MDNQEISTWGGKRPNSGRKSKSEEQALVEKLTPMNDLAFDALREALSEGEPWAVKLFFEYQFGKPKTQIDVTSSDNSLASMPIYTWIETDEEDS